VTATKRLRHYAVTVVTVATVTGTLYLVGVGDGYDGQGPSFLCGGLEEVWEALFVVGGVEPGR
jgi:hypothetical protein